MRASFPDQQASPIIRNFGYVYRKVWRYIGRVLVFSQSLFACCSLCLYHALFSVHVFYVVTMESANLANLSFTANVSITVPCSLRSLSWITFRNHGPSDGLSIIPLPGCYFLLCPEANACLLGFPVVSDHLAYDMLILLIRRDYYLLVGYIMVPNHPVYPSGT